MPSKSRSILRSSKCWHVSWSFAIYSSEIPFKWTKSSNIWTCITQWRRRERSCRGPHCGSNGILARSDGDGQSLDLAKWTNYNDVAIKYISAWVVVDLKRRYRNFWMNEWIAILYLYIFSVISYTLSSFVCLTSLLLFLLQKLAAGEPGGVVPMPALAGTLLSPWSDSGSLYYMCTFNPQQLNIMQWIQIIYKTVITINCHFMQRSHSFTNSL